ncbi:two-component system chemotaxis sensor kinase CheA [Caldalkalibacillus uzonensis]|uniref:Chemotaxis protein CheA n=1 Tax=Caldalkalibacillus uzonensis TaxID=353224 RepID=A0ABU0CLJ8_9BACI|nr:chemotaxis protein CheA [Caldalkalibacillus uzonensis]MDQ0337284.1 two-component system chemotaxis sensor kinase CheA [Caldalkalibacillus uzonensis]
MDMNQYMDAFIDEATQHLQSINGNLLLLEKEPANLELVQEIFRSAHTLKGMAATMGFEEVAELTHHLENVLDQVRNRKLTVSTPMMDTLFFSVDALEKMIDALINEENAQVDVGQVIQALNGIQGDGSKGASSSGEEQTQDRSSSVPRAILQAVDQFALTVLTQSEETGFNIYHIQVTLDKGCLLKAARAYMVFQLLESEGEIIQTLPPVQDIEEEAFESAFELIYVTKQDTDYVQQLIHKVSEIEQVHVQPVKTEELKYHQSQEIAEGALETAAASAPSADSEQLKSGQPETSPHRNGSQRTLNKTIRVNIDRLDALMNLFSELVIDRGRLEKISKELQHQELIETVEHMSRMSSDLQDLILNMRMVPIEQVFNRFPKMVRSLSRELGKEVELAMSGTETELDRTVIDEIGDPLVHLLRNAIDHGLETTEERKRLGKPEQGRLELKAYHSGNHVFIEVRDDGRGIDRSKVLKKAIERGVISRERSEELSDQDVYQLLFASGFSTAEKVSDISGRGVGLDVVKNKIESLGGNVSVLSQPGAGTTFTVQLPLTLSIISALLVKVMDETYAIPLTSIIEVAAVKQEDIRSVQGQRVIDFRGKVVPLVSLQDVFEVPGEVEEDGILSIVIVKKGEKMAGLIVDSLIGQQEVVLKTLGQYLNQVFAISGATILGDGQVALIIDCNALIK